MRWLPLVLAPSALGCSLIYNPSDLPQRPIDGPPEPDAEIVLDADPSRLELERVTPSQLLEGIGSGTARRTLLVVHGKQIVPGAKITVALHTGETVDPLIVVDDALTEVADNGFMVAAPISIGVNTALAKDAFVRLDVTVTQPNGMGGEVSQTLSELMDPAPDTPVLRLRGLDELVDADPETVENVTLPPGEHQFSQVLISGTLAATANTAPLQVRATGSIEIRGTAQVNANSGTPGPGGATGGAGGQALDLGDPGKPGQGISPGTTSGGGGGFGTAGGKATGGAATALASIPDVRTHRGSGGAGGDGFLLNPGGAGGASGGVLELTAGDTLSVATVQALGGISTNVGGNDGGGGSGGAIVLRGSSVTISGAIAVDGGSGRETGGAGGAGRARIDVPIAGNEPIANGSGAFRGPKLAASTPLIVRTATPVVTVVGQPFSQYTYSYLDDAGQVAGPFTANALGTDGTTELTMMPLSRGLNQVCLHVDGAVFGDRRPEATNCVDLVYLFKLP